MINASPTSNNATPTPDRPLLPRRRLRAGRTDPERHHGGASVPDVPVRPRRRHPVPVLDRRLERRRQRIVLLPLRVPEPAPGMSPRHAGSFAPVGGLRRHPRPVHRPDSRPVRPRRVLALQHLPARRPQPVPPGGLAAGAHGQGRQPHLLHPLHIHRHPDPTSWPASRATAGTTRTCSAKATSSRRTGMRASAGTSSACSCCGGPCSGQEELVRSTASFRLSTWGSSCDGRRRRTGSADSAREPAVYAAGVGRRCTGRGPSLASGLPQPLHGLLRDRQVHKIDFLFALFLVKKIPLNFYCEYYSRGLLCSDQVDADTGLDLPSPFA
jgi:hypothetical protein